MTAVNKTNKIKIETHRGRKTLLENIPEFLFSSIT
jgi:hypothetical protein